MTYTTEYTKGSELIKLTGHILPPFAKWWDKNCQSTLVLEAVEEPSERYLRHSKWFLRDDDGSDCPLFEDFADGDTTYELWEDFQAFVTPEMWEAYMNDTPYEHPEVDPEPSQEYLSDHVAALDGKVSLLKREAEDTEQLVEDLETGVQENTTALKRMADRVGYIERTLEELQKEPSEDSKKFSEALHVVAHLDGVKFQDAWEEVLSKTQEAMKTPKEKMEDLGVVPGTYLAFSVPGGSMYYVEAVEERSTEFMCNVLIKGAKVSADSRLVETDYEWVLNVSEILNGNFILVSEQEFKYALVKASGIVPESYVMFGSDSTGRVSAVGKVSRVEVTNTGHIKIHGDYLTTNAPTEPKENFFLTNQEQLLQYSVDKTSNGQIVPSSKDVYDDYIVDHGGSGKSLKFSPGDYAKWISRDRKITLYMAIEGVEDCGVYSTLEGVCVTIKDNSAEARGNVKTQYSPKVHEDFQFEKISRQDFNEAVLESSPLKVGSKMAMWDDVRKINEDLICFGEVTKLSISHDTIHVGCEVRNQGNGYFSKVSNRNYTMDMTDLFEIIEHPHHSTEWIPVPIPEEEYQELLKEFVPSVGVEDLSQSPVWVPGMFIEMECDEDVPTIGKIEEVHEDFSSNHATIYGTFYQYGTSDTIENLGVRSNPQDTSSSYYNPKPITKERYIELLEEHLNERDY